MKKVLLSFAVVAFMASCGGEQAHTEDAHGHDAHGTEAEHVDARPSACTKRRSDHFLTSV